ncbi:MAG: DNA polymerase I [Candidatus Eisenbacteria bacterium]|nr:DNA polymerase I [Candidatus Eisenbacteria bacterium]
MKRIFLVDGSQLAYRSHFAFIKNPLRSSKTGEITSATFGFARTLKKLLEEAPEYIAVVFDSKAPTFRHEQFKEYKANRPGMPEELVSQLPRIKELVDAFSISSIELPGYEGDDVIGTLAKAASDRGFEVVIVSGDKDLLQLVSPSVRLLIPGRSGEEAKVMGEGEVLEKYGIRPDQIVDMLALAGDATDNVPGVKGIGEKTAVTLLVKYGSVEAIFRDELAGEKERLRERLRQGKESALLSKELVTIKCDVPVPVGLEQLQRKEPDQARLSVLGEALEFRWLRDLGRKSEKMEGAYEMVDEAGRSRVLGKLRDASVVSVAVRSTAEDPMKGAVLGIALSIEPGKAFCFSPRPGGDELHPDELKMLGETVFSNQACVKVGHNLKDDLIPLERSGIRTSGGIFDVSVACYLLNPGSRTDMDFLLEARNLGRLTPKEGEVPSGDLLYACERADSAMRLFEILKRELRLENLESVFSEIEMPLLLVLKDMQMAGVHVDTGILTAMSAELGEELSRLEAEIYETSGYRFNINSPQQIADVLFEKHKLPRGKRTKKGYSTDFDVLEALAVSFELPRKIIDYRQLYKLKSTYLDALPQAINERTGRIHASFNQTVTTTGRLSSSEPNLQNIPFRGELGRKIRKAFTAEKPGWSLLSADYSQIELRILAHLSRDVELVRAFKSGEDIHAITASRIFDVPESLVSDDMRAKAKVVNFGVIYGMSQFGLSRELRISRERAGQFIQKFFESYGGVKRYIDILLEDARKEGVVRTMTGRKRHVPEIRSKNERLRAEGERAAINAPIQGSAADIMKKAMMDISRELKRLKAKAKLILQIHDELLFELPDDEADEVEPLIKSLMENAVPLSVPVVVRTGKGKSWYDAH